MHLFFLRWNVKKPDKYCIARWSSLMHMIFNEEMIETQKFSAVIAAYKWKRVIWWDVAVRLLEFEANVCYSLKFTWMIIKITTLIPCVTYHRLIDGSRYLIMDKRMESDDVVSLSHLDINIVKNDSIVNTSSNNFVFMVNPRRTKVIFGDNTITCTRVIWFWLLDRYSCLN